MGGALAAIAALDLKVSPTYESSRSQIGNVIVYTFGSPKWCNDNLAKYWDSVIDASFRVVNKNDVIPSNPPKQFDYWHVSMEIRYTSNNPLKYKVCTEPYGNHWGCYYGVKCVMCSNEDDCVLCGCFSIQCMTMRIIWDKSYRANH